MNGHFPTSYTFISLSRPLDSVCMRNFFVSIWKKRSENYRNANVSSHRFRRYGSANVIEPCPSKPESRSRWEMKVEGDNVETGS